MIKPTPTMPLLLLLAAALLSLSGCEQPTAPPDNTEYGSFSGLVLDQETELPIAAAVVTALKNAVTDTTDSQGAFLLDSLALGPDTIMVTLALHDTQYSIISISEGSQQDTIYLYFTPWEGGEWELLGLEGEDIAAIAIDPTDEKTIYAGGVFSNLFKTTNGGAAWDILIDGTVVRDIDIHPTDHNTVYVLHAGVQKTTDGGGSWARIDTGISYHIFESPYTLAIDPQYPETLYLGTAGFGEGGLYKSTDGGAVWRRISYNTPLDNDIAAIAIDPQNTNTIYAGTGRMWKSTDGGESWERLMYLETYDLLVNPTNPDNIYAGTEDLGFFISTDAGASWQAANTGLSDHTDINEIALSITGQIYVATCDGEKVAVYESAPDNIQWTMIGGQGSFELGVLWNPIALSEQYGVLYMGSKGIYCVSIANQ